MTNDEKKLNILSNKLNLAAPIDEVYSMDKDDTQAKNHEEIETKKNIAPEASAKLAKKRWSLKAYQAEIAERL